ncbi:hypothetical protein A2348_02545 [Candidatus Uhrbacteria bacterium RIFOXYB12_FULL_58_10]|nr:MAG: hypothetical protein A2348_02545 [Candidatus Uhrbacteria bacterium RIFOXYB12_FULL_58_10]
MIAEVYPIMRMPRRFGIFDYEFPEEKTILRGTFVRIPFRFGETMGVVARVKEGGGRGIKLKQIASVFEEILPFSDAELSAIEDIAFDVAQSVSTILYASVPKLTKRELKFAQNESVPLTIPAREAPSITLAASQVGQRAASFVAMPDVRRSCVLLTAYLREHPDEPVMALLPNVRDAKLIASRLGGFSPIVVTGEETPLERARAWRAWRACKTGLLIGTRTAALWTHPALGAIFLLRSGHPNHKQDERNPRFDARAVAEILRIRLHARVIYVDVAPRADDLATLDPIDLLGPRTRPPSAVADMNVERFGAPHPRIGQSALLRIAETLSTRRRVLCAYNLKGVSRRLQCADCSYRFPCLSCGGVFASYGQTIQCHRCGRIEPTPLSCPSCNGSRLAARGYGNRAVAAALQTLFPEATVRCVEKGTDPAGSDQSDILVVTRHYYENIFDPFQPPNVGLVVDLDADLPLYEPTMRAVEHAILNMEEWRGVANACRADFLVQTEVPDLFRSIFSERDRVLSDDLTTRQAYGQPPFRRICMIRFRSSEPHERDHALRAMSDRIREGVPTAMISDGENLRVSIPPEDKNLLFEIFSNADDGYIIDTRPLE